MWPWLGFHDDMPHLYCVSKFVQSWFLYTWSKFFQIMYLSCGILISEGGRSLSVQLHWSISHLTIDNHEIPQSIALSEVDRLASFSPWILVDAKRGKIDELLNIYIYILSPISNAWALTCLSTFGYRVVLCFNDFLGLLRRQLTIIPMRLVHLINPSCWISRTNPCKALFSVDKENWLMHSKKKRRYFLPWSVNVGICI